MSPFTSAKPAKNNLKGVAVMTKSLALSLLTLATAASAYGAPIPIYTQNFDSLTPGSINGQDGWSSAATDVVQSTTAVSGQALKAASGGTGPNRNAGSSP